LVKVIYRIGWKKYLGYTIAVCRKNLSIIYEISTEKTLKVFLRKRAPVSSRTEEYRVEKLFEQKELTVKYYDWSSGKVGAISLTPG
jgi:hypothetical protein